VFPSSLPVAKSRYVSSSKISRLRLHLIASTPHPIVSSSRVDIVSVCSGAQRPFNFHGVLTTSFLFFDHGSIVGKQIRYCFMYGHCDLINYDRQHNDAQLHEPPVEEVEEDALREPGTTFCNSTRMIHLVFKSVRRQYLWHR
jgi:hypothetical protein